MEESYLCLDVYPHIFRHLEWSKLHEMILINRHFRYLTQKEIRSRWLSDKPLGDDKAKFIVVSEHIYLESIFCQTGESTVWIDPRDWSKTWFLNFFEKYFSFSFTQERYVMTNSLFKQLIRFINHKLGQDADPINEFRQTMIFTANFDLLSFK